MVRVYAYILHESEVHMVPIEQTSDGMLLFLKCGCRALRARNHPTGAAALVIVTQPCEEHVGYDTPLEGSLVRSVAKGEMVSPFVRTLVTPESLRDLEQHS
jgi:hypothetical protein